MWDLGNRGFIVLVSALSGCVFVCNVTVPIIALTLTLTLVLVSFYACYCLLVDDRSQSTPRRALLQFVRFIEETAVKINQVLRNAVFLYFSGVTHELRDIIRRLYDKRLAFTMQKPRAGNSYQLSTDTSVPRSSSSRFGGLDRFSPIPRLENRLYRNSDIQQSPSNQHSGSFSKFTSTPMTSWKKDDSRNGDLAWNGRSSWKKPSPTHDQSNSTSHRENSMYSSGDESQWGVSSNPKMRSKAAGVKTVQTTAGPLLASTRYNIDSKVYSDVTSPGLTTRLSKYAMEANDKLTHQSQYGPGQFPRVNLNASPVPLLNTKYAKTKTSVMVRIAPPESTRYSPPERQKILSNLCLQETKGQQNVARVLREMSLKRHASGEDVTSDLAKKQRTDGMFSDNVIQCLEETKQKRSRDESSKSEEDLSPENKTVRPTKRTKTPSCYDILNSLSSSVHVISGVKRKAIHLSRSGTPDFGKHFKSLDNTQSGNSHTSPQSSIENLKQSKNDSDDRHLKHMELVSQTLQKVEEQSSRKGILQSRDKGTVLPKDNTQESKVQVKDPSPSTKAVHLRDKLFMRAEPQKTDKLKLLVEEHTDVKAKFTTNDVEEIKKEDIVNMRQTSMRARLQSMFDAISGKTKSKINPDVVIQAEEVASTPTVTSSACVTLNSSTTTTNVNTSPIATSAITPIELTTKPNAKPTKHVTFNLPESSTVETSTSVTSVGGQSTPNIQTTSTTPFGSNNPTTWANSPTTPLLAFGAQPSSKSPASTASFVKPVSSPSATITSSSALSTNVSSPPATALTTSGAFTSKGSISSLIASNANTANSAATVSSTPSFAFGNSPITSTPSFAKPAVSSDKNVLGTSTTNFAVQAAGTAQPSGTSSTVTSTSKNPINSTPATTSATSTPVFTFGSKSTPQTASFGTPQSTTPTITFGTPQTTAQVSTFGTPQTTTQAPTFGTPQTSKAGGYTLGTSSSQNTNIFETAATPQGVTTTTASSTFSKDNSTPAASTTSSAFSSFASPASTAVFTFGANSALPTSNSKPVFSFNAITTSGSNTTSSAMPVFGATTNSSASLGFSTPTTTTPQVGATSAPLFGSSAATTSSFASQPLFSATPSSSTAFSAPKSTAAPAFNSNVSTPAFGTPTTTTSSLFSSITNAPITNASTTKSSAFATTSTGIFGQTSTAFGAGSQVFGTTTPSFFGSQTTTASTFGASNTSTTTSAFANTQSLPAFGTVSAGTSGITSSSAQPTPVFGSTPNTTAGSAFGSAGSSSAPRFGASATPATASFGASTTSVTRSFGASTTSATGSFGASTTSATGSFGASTTSAPGSFGASTTSAPGSFGASTTSATGSFGASTTSAPGSFGASTTPATGSFGAPSTTSSTFGTQSAAAPAYGAASTSANTFATNPPTPFGATHANASATPVFGAPTSAPAFGASGSNTANSTFSFGGNQPVTQQNTTFSFGSNAASSSTTNAGPAPFQFGAGSSKPATTGFNFSAPSATPTINFGSTSSTPVFNAPTAGMFSIGSGSSAPRSRSVRSRKPR